MNPAWLRMPLIAFATFAVFIQFADAQRTTTPERRPVPVRPTPSRPGETREPLPDQLPDARFKVGDRVTLRLTLSDRTEFNLAAQHGKIVLLDFWMSTDIGITDASARKPS